MTLGIFLTFFPFIFLILLTTITKTKNKTRRVHVTKATLEHLGDKFEVEPGFGSSREQYLADHKIETYLIIPPKVRLQMMNYYFHEKNTNDHIKQL